VPARDAAREIPVRPLGMPDVASFQWRKRGGQAAFATARKAADRKDWPAVVAAAREAVAADPTHLEAQWLLAIGLGNIGQLDAMREAMRIAIDGNPGDKMALDSDRPELFQAELDLRRDADAAFRKARERSILVIAGGDVYAFDPDDKRWFRVTQTGGAVTAAVDGYYLERSKRGTSIGVLDYEHTVDNATLLSVVKPPIVIVTNDSGRFLGTGAAWRQFNGGWSTPPKKMPRPQGDSIEIWNHNIKIHHKPRGKVKADWDEQLLASAMRVGDSERIVTVPSPGLIDGNTLVWSPDKQHVAFVALLEEHCEPSAPSTAAFVADVATGSAHELERASGGIAIEWAGSARVAIAGDHGVSLVSIDGGAPETLEGADGLAIPRRTSKCTPKPPEDVEDTP